MREGNGANGAPSDGVCATPDEVMTGVPRRLFLTRSIASAAALSPIGALLAGCGSGTSTQSTVANAKPPARPTGTFMVALSQAPTSLDPGRRLGVGSFYATANIYDGLVTWNKDFSDVAPQLCESWDVSPDAREWVGKLRPGMTFHDGTPIDATAIRKNFEYFVKNAAYLFIPLPLKTIDDSQSDTIRFVFKSPYPYFTKNVTLLKIQSVKAIEAGPKAIDKHPIGSGPFEFVSQDANSIALRRFAQYWNKPRPYFEEVRYRIIPDAAARLAAVRSGQVNLATNLAPEDVAQLKTDSRVKVISRPSWMMTTLNFKLTAPAVSDLRVRQAIAYAIDRQAILKSLGRGEGQVARGFMMPGIEGYSPMTPSYGYDPEKARALLSEIGSVQPVRMALPSGDAAANYLQSEAVAQAIAGQLKTVGFQATVDAIPEAQYQKERAALRPAHPVALNGYIWFNGGPTVYSFMEADHNMAAAYPKQYAQYKKLWDQMNAELDKTKRVELIKQIQQIHTDLLPSIPLFTLPVADAVSKQVFGYAPDVRNFGPELGGAYFAS
jgi:peptide/nickel transport system substrate-binding protein